MLPQVPGYRLLEVLFQGQTHLVYRGVRERDGEPVVIKTCNPRVCGPEDRVRLVHEHEIQSTLDLPGVVRALAIEGSGEALRLILEDTGGRSLSQVMKEVSFPVSQVLDLGVRVADILESLHAQGVAHLDVNPANLLVSEDRSRIWLCDFAAATRLAFGGSDSDSLTLRGDLAYIAPEQTGRVQGEVDERADLYALGVTLYQLLSGQLPFRSDDPMELVHQHIAKRPVPLVEVSDRIPAAVSAVVERLLAKAPAERYRSAFGVACDLRRCRDRLVAGTPDAAFEPGERDVMTRFRPTGKLFGREAANARLLEAVARASQGERLLVLVQGPAGVGKSVLIRQLRLCVLDAGGVFVAGKYEQVQRDVPYRALIQALRELLGQVLSMDPDGIDAWRHRIRKAMGPNGRILGEVLPELALIIGSQPEVESLPAPQDSVRFTSLLLALIRVCANPGQPLVIFLDDLQWADTASLDLLRPLLVDDECRYLLVLSTQRTPEPGDESPSALLVQTLEARGGIVERLPLEPLNGAALRVMLGETFGREEAATEPLVAVLLEKTSGNPFFVQLFLRSLVEQRLLHFDSGRGHWDWDLEEIRALAVTANVARFMSERIHTLPPPTRRLLELAACIGSRFDLAILSGFCAEAPEQVVRTLRPALEGRFVRPLNERHNLAEQYSGLTDGAPSVQYQFVHDWVQQAAYLRLSPAQRAEIHLRIGQLMLPGLVREKGADALPYVADQINRGRGLIRTDTERLEAARLDLEAGRKAKASAAFATALHFYDAGVELLPPDTWQSDPELALALWRERAEAMYLTGDLHGAEAAFEALLGLDLPDLEKARIYHTRLLLYTAIGRYSDAIAQGLAGLALLGTRLSVRPSLARVLWTHWRARRLLRRSDPAGLPPLNGEVQELVLDLLVCLETPCYLSGNENLMAVANLEAVTLSLRHGNGRASAFAFTGYAVLLVSVLGDPTLGDWLGVRAESLARDSRVLWYRSKTYFMLSNTVRHWRHPFAEGLPMMRQALQDCIDSGDNLFGCYSSIRLPVHRFYMGDPLSQVEEEAQLSLRLVRRTGDQAMVDNAMLWLQFYRALMGRTTGPLDWDDGDFRMDAALERMCKAGFRSGQTIHAVCRAQIELLYGNFEGAIRRLREVHPHMHSMLGMVETVVAVFVEALALASLASALTGPARLRLHLRLLPRLRRLGRWSRASPANYGACYLLVRAEHAAAKGRILEALRDYEQAASQAAASGLVQVEAMSREWAARFCHRNGFSHAAREHLEAAIRRYRQWGAEPKAVALEETLERWEPGILPTIPSEGSGSSSGRHLQLDLDTVIRAAETISGEMLSERLLERLLDLVISNAGAERAVLLLHDQSGLRVQAERESASDRCTLLAGTPLDDYPGLPKSVVHFVERSLQRLVLSDAAGEGGYAADPYIRRQRVRSVLCLPIVRQGKPIAVLYLENNLAPGVFTENRVRLLSVLSSQMAISIENAELYRGLRRAADDLEQYNRALESKVQARTAELNQALVRVERANAEVLDSLAYAKLIQESLLPGPDSLRALGRDHVLLWLPRDIVGGDIYCLHRVGDALVLVLADCTGHGVPGALMTVVAVSALRQIVEVEGCVHPCEILRRLNVEVRRALGQDSGAECADNGMDAAVCCLPGEPRRLLFAGARLGLHLVQGDRPQFYRGDRHSIGYRRSDPNRRFIMHEIVAEAGAWVYLVSDGYADQLGGERGFPMGRSHLERLLLSCAAQGGDQQHAHLLEALDNHRGERPRQDDVTLIGFQI